VEVSKIKNLVIAALVILNIVFLGSFLWRQITEETGHREALENLSTVMAQNGIALDPQAVYEGEALPFLKTSRDTSGEKLVAEAVLGDTVKTDQGGNIFCYTGRDGEALFRNGGEFEFMLNQGAIGIGKGAEDTAERLLKAMRVDAVISKTEGEIGSETVKAVCSWGKTLIYNCSITFEYQNGYLIKINGKRATNIQSTDEYIEMSSAETAVLSFLDAVKNGKYSCTVINSVSPGYYLTSVSEVDVGELNAVWRIVTDTGTYYVNASTCFVEPGL
jgi:hypothetical protein